MNLEELYQKIGGDYSQAVKVLRMERLIDKHIRKFPNNPIFPALAEAAKTMDASGLFEQAHAIKGVTANLGLVQISELASKVSEEFRPGNPRTMSDEEVRSLVDEISRLFQVAVEGIEEYSQSAS